MDGKPAPAGADLQQVVVGVEPQPLADAVELGDLGLLEVGALVREPGARIHHLLVEEGGEEVVAEVVVGGDVLAGAAARVLRDQPPRPVQEAAGADDRAAQASRPLQLASGDPDQGDEVVGLPEAVDVGLAEAEAAAQRAAPGARVVDGHRRPQLGAGGAEGAGAAVLDDLDPAAAQAAQHLGDGGAGGCVAHAHGARNPFGLRPSGCGK